jgi:beta-glucosidase
MYATEKVKNIGKTDGRETVQIYVESPDTRENRRLVGIGPVAARAGKSARVSVKIAPDAFSRRNEFGDFYLLAGPHTLHVGFSQPDPRSVDLTGYTPVEVVVE